MSDTLADEMERLAVGVNNSTIDTILTAFEVYRPVVRAKLDQGHPLDDVLDDLKAQLARFRVGGRE